MPKKEKKEVQSVRDLPQWRQSFYKVVMMGGKEYPLDESEIVSIKTGMAKGSFIQLKQAIINPSSISSIEVDEIRTRDYRKEVDNVYQRNQYIEKGESEEAYPVPRSLANLFPKKESVDGMQRIGN